MEKLGKNHGGYHGETIDIRAVLRDIQAAAQQHGWTSEIFATTRRIQPDSPSIGSPSFNPHNPQSANPHLPKHRHTWRRACRAARGVALASGKPVAGERRTVVLPLPESDGFRFEPT